MMSECDVLSYSYITSTTGNREKVAQYITDFSLGTSARTLVYQPWREASYDIVASAPYKMVNEKYMCPYCGTTFIATEGGFVPECKNCGGTLRLEE